MRRYKKLFAGLVLSGLFFFGVATFVESHAWARAGGGGSSGSRGSRSFSAPSTPSSPSLGSPGLSAPGRAPFSGAPGQSSGGFFGRSPFMQGLAGGLAGGMLGSLLFGGVGHASAGGAMGGGIGLMDLAIIGLLLYLAFRFFKKKREQQMVASESYAQGRYETDNRAGSYGAESLHDARYGASEMEGGFRQMRQLDPSFSEETLKEAFQDIFFKVQAAWMNRSFSGVEGAITGEMIEFFRGEFEEMRAKGRINRLENIAVRRVEPTEVWQEMGRDYVTVLFTANLLDYTVDEKTGEVVGGDKANPVKFQEFWTFSREIGSLEWRLSAINQPGETPGRKH